MVREAHRIVEELGERTLVKIPSNAVGYKVMKQLKKDGIRFIGTAVYTPMQGWLAAACGAEYIAPYVNRIDNMGFDGVKVAKDIHDAIKNSGFEYSGLLAASFKNSQQVLELTKYGVKAGTVAPDIIEGLVKNAAIDAAIAQFTKDFAGLVGEGKTMEDC
jgi:fructose-6-phosphate aldolase 2